MKSVGTVTAAGCSPPPPGDQRPFLGACSAVNEDGSPPLGPSRPASQFVGVVPARRADYAACAGARLGEGARAEKADDRRRDSRLNEAAGAVRFRPPPKSYAHLISAAAQWLLVLEAG